MELKEKLLDIQVNLKAPKSQFNKFGNYPYRNIDDILEATKPLCAENKVVLTLSDEIVLIGDRYYIKATAKLSDCEKSEFIEVTSFARESESKKGMDDCQVTGTASSYARKYALNGLFNIDDTKDADHYDNSTKEPEKQKTTIVKQTAKVTTDFKHLSNWVAKIQEIQTETYYNDLIADFKEAGLKEAEKKFLFNMIIKYLETNKLAYYNNVLHKFDWVK
jgi:hypothetical protein